MAAMRFCFLLFCLSLASVSSVKKLTNIDDLKNTRYANRLPRHGLQLLFWFAHILNLDQNNNMLLNFLPNNGNFGFHYFGNYGHLLPSLSSRQSYYAVGNLNVRVRPLVSDLPDYVQRHYRNSNLPERNMDRLIVSSEKNSISRVFATAHYRGSNDFNPFDTYEIDPALILQIRQAHCNILLNEYTEEHRFSLFLHQIASGYSGNCLNVEYQTKLSLDSQCEEIELQIKTTTQGSSKLIWKNIPDNLFETVTLYIDICQNTYSSGTNDDPKRVIKLSFDIHESNGFLDTSVLLNAGLQPRLRRSESDVLWYGPEVDGDNKVPPIRIKGFDASLQLYVANGKACARLYIKKTFINWKKVFSSSWVGFYKSSQDKSENYDNFRYVVDFAMMDKDATGDYSIYQYDSSLTIAPGVQIRFLLDKNYNKVLAQTTPWQSDEEETSAWSFPEFFFEPEFYDANNVVPIKIGKYDAGLRLFTKDGKACAQLYIKKTFTTWKEAFRQSWVGFYTGSQHTNNKYVEYKHATKFKKKVGDTENFDIYEYNSDLTIEPGVQIRFLKDNGYDKQLVATEPWKSC